MSLPPGVIFLVLVILCVIYAKLTTKSEKWKVSEYGLFTGSYFLIFRLSTEIYRIDFRIHSNNGKYRPEKSPLRKVLMQWCTMYAISCIWMNKQAKYMKWKRKYFKQILTCNWIFQKIIIGELLVCYWKSFLLKKSLYFCSIIYLTLFSKSKTNFFYCEYSYSSIEGRGYLHRHLSFTIYHLSFIIYHRCFCDKERFILLLLSDSQKIQIERDKKWRW